MARKPGPGPSKKQIEIEPRFRQFEAPEEGMYILDSQQVRLRKGQIVTLLNPGQSIEGPLDPGPGVMNYPSIGGVPEDDLPQLDEYFIRDDLFPPPANCKQNHIYTAMKISRYFSELGTLLYYGCPHNRYLREALRDLKVAHEGCNKAILSDLE